MSQGFEETTFCVHSYWDICLVHSGRVFKIQMIGDKRLCVLCLKCWYFEVKAVCTECTIYLSIRTIYV